MMTSSSNLSVLRRVVRRNVLGAVAAAGVVAADDEVSWAAAPDARGVERRLNLGVSWNCC